MVSANRHLTFSHTVQPGSQFLGTEFSIQTPNRRKGLKVVEFSLHMGTELKTFRIEKRNAQGQILALLHQSLDPSTGNPAPAIAESVVISGGDFDTYLVPGEQVQVVTSGATSGMRATLRAVEFDL